MEMKINQVQNVEPSNQVQRVQNTDDSFKFTLISKIEEEGLQERLKLMTEEIVQHGKKIAKHMDIKDLRKYRELIKAFMNEIVNRSHKVSRENYLDRRGRHRIFSIVKLIDKNLDELASELIKDEKDHIAILGKIDEIKGMLLDLLT